MTPRIHKYATEACTRFDSTPARVMSRAKSVGDVRARRYVIERLRADGFSLGQIGKWLGRHHTTIMYHLGMTK